MKLVDATRFRHHVYAPPGVPTQGGQPFKASDFVRLDRSALPPMSALGYCGNTPQPYEFLNGHLTYLSYSNLLAFYESEVAQKDMEAANALQQAPEQMIVFVMGQVQYSVPSEVHRAVIAYLTKGAYATLPTVHQRSGGGYEQQGCHNHHGGRSTQANSRFIGKKKHTGMLHTLVPASQESAFVNACHQRAYYDRDGVWLAMTDAGVRRLGIFERVMGAYMNGVPTGRPKAPLTVERARRQALASMNGAY